MRRGQIVISDLVVSLGIFLILLVVAYGAWDRTMDQVSEWREQAEAEEALARTLSALVRSPGDPPYWAATAWLANDSRIRSMGTAGAPGVLDGGRLNRLDLLLDTDTNYYDAKRKLGTGPYQLDINISDLSGRELSYSGRAPGPESRVAGTAQEMAWYNQSAVRVRVRLWRNETG